MDISTLELRGAFTQATPQGPSVSEDSSIVATAQVADIDSERGLVRIVIRDGDVTLPAVAGRYSRDSLARVLIDATSARPVLVIGPVRPRPPVELGIITGLPSTNVVTVILGDEEYEIPAAPGSYVVNESAWIELDDWGTPVLALAPSTLSGQGGGSGPSAPATPTSTIVANATIGPQVTGTWRSSVSRWDQWNPGRYGLGATPIYQGDAYGSGPLIGYAGYGDQIVNLGAVSIEAITMKAVKGADGNTAALTVQGSAAGTRPGGAPSGTGGTASTGSIPSGGTGELALDAGMRDAFRTGAIKGLIAVGSQYGGFGGFGAPPSFVLQIRYTKLA